MSFDLLTYDARTNAANRRMACARRTEDLERQHTMATARRVGLTEFVLARLVEQYPVTARLFSQGS